MQTSLIHECKTRIRKGRVARRDGPTGAGGVFYYFSDHLKTASVIADSAGNIKSESDYYPWGGELQFVNNDSNHYKFTGKERDAESGLDYFGARYYSNGLGRFKWSTKPVSGLESMTEWYVNEPVPLAAPIPASLAAPCAPPLIWMSLVVLFAHPGHLLPAGMKITSYNHH